MRIAFFGTPEAAVPALRALAEADDVEIAAVVTNPDRPRGRSGRPAPPPAKEVAGEHGLAVWQPANAREVASDLDALAIDACAVVAYGALLPRAVLDAGGHGFVNLHFSLLPRWRGAAPVQHALRAGDTVTGVTTFVLDEGMDTGPILRILEVPIEPDETAGELLDRLARVGAPVLLDSLRALVAGEPAVPQPEEGATLAPKVSPQDVGIDWTAGGDEVVNLVRSASPAPGAHTTFDGRRLKVLRARRDSRAAGEAGAPPGSVVAAADDGPVVATGGGTVVLTEVQPEGKGRMEGGAFVNGYRPVGSLLGA